jgi:feruloyl-CoA synthase
MYFQYWNRPSHRLPIDPGTDPHAESEGDGFALACGTWVDAAALHRALIAATGPLLSDALLVGEDREAIGLLVFADEKACRTWLRAQLGDGAPEDQPHMHVLIWDEIAQFLQDFNRRQGTTCRRIARFSIMIDPPSIAYGEITAQGALNRHAIVRRRSRQVEELFTRARR